MSRESQQRNESQTEPSRKSLVGKTFVLPSQQRQAEIDAERAQAKAEAEELAAQRASGKVTRRQALSAGGLGLLSLAMIIGAGGNGSDPGTDIAPGQLDRLATARAAQADISQLSSALVSPADALRATSKALQSARQIMSIQSEAAVLAQRVSHGASVKDNPVANELRVRLRPYFRPDVPQDQLSPWYLLAADQSVGLGVGTANTFASGVVWRLEQAQLIDTSSTIPVIWRAHERAGGDLLAIVTAEYEMVHEVFTTPHVIRTQVGRKAALAVST